MAVFFHEKIVFSPSPKFKLRDMGKIFVLKGYKAKIYTLKLRLIILITWLIFSWKTAFVSNFHSYHPKDRTQNLGLIIASQRWFFIEKMMFFPKFDLTYIVKICILDANKLENRTQNLRLIIVSQSWFFHEKRPSLQNFFGRSPVLKLFFWKKLTLLRSKLFRIDLRYSDFRSV